MRFGQHVVTMAVNYTIIFIMPLVFGQRTSTDITGIAELFALKCPSAVNVEEVLR